MVRGGGPRRSGGRARRARLRRRPVLPVRARRPRRGPPSARLVPPAGRLGVGRPAPRRAGAGLGPNCAGAPVAALVHAKVCYRAPMILRCRPRPHEAAPRLAGAAAPRAACVRGASAPARPREPCRRAARLSDGLKAPKLGEAAPRPRRAAARPDVNDGEAARACSRLGRVLSPNLVYARAPPSLAARAAGACAGRLYARRAHPPASRPARSTT